MTWNQLLERKAEFGLEVEITERAARRSRRQFANSTGVMIGNTTIGKAVSIVSVRKAGSPKRLYTKNVKVPIAVFLDQQVPEGLVS